jgi:predicted NBD/HSP70 family sugar kinase
LTDTGQQDRSSPSGGSPNRLGQLNRHALLRELRVGAPLSRANLAKRTGISKPAVTRGIADLMDAGLVMETGRGKATTGGGPRPTLLHLNPRAAAALGCSIEVGRVVAVLAGFDGNVEARRLRNFDPEASPADVVALAARLLRETLAENPSERPVLGLGVGLPGIVDEHGRVLVIPHMQGWRGVELAEQLETEFAIPVRVDSKSRIQTLAEGWLGQGRDVETFVCLDTGIGIGAGVVVNRRLLRGRQSLAGEVGHWSMYSEADRCYCDSHSCWEVRGSTDRLLADLRTSSIAHNDVKLHEGELGLGDVARVAAIGDATALRELAVHADSLARGISNLVIAYDPERIIIGGDSTIFGDLLLGMLKDRVRERFALWLDYEPPIVFSELGADSGLAGAVGLALQQAWGLADTLDPLTR